jgi:hypothetical protein
VWLGPLLSVAGFLSYFFYFVAFPALRDWPWVNLPLVLGGFALSVIAVWRAFARSDRYRGRVFGSLGLALSLLVTGFFCAYIFWISYQVPPPSSVATTLAVAPDLELPDHTGKTVRLADLRGRKVVLTFYRGHW